MANRLSDVQLSELKEAFDVLDKDMDGLLSTEDIQSAFQQLASPLAPEDVQRFIEEVDTLNTGNIDFVELLSVMATYMKRKTLERGETSIQVEQELLRDTFLRFTDGESTLSLDRFQQLVAVLGEDWSSPLATHDEAVRQTFTELVGDTTGTLTLRQFIDHMQDNY